MRLNCKIRTWNMVGGFTAGLQGEQISSGSFFRHHHRNGLGTNLGVSILSSSPSTTTAKMHWTRRVGPASDGHPTSMDRTRGPFTIEEYIPRIRTYSLEGIDQVASAVIQWRQFYGLSGPRLQRRMAWSGFSSTALAQSTQELAQGHFKTPEG